MSRKDFRVIAEAIVQFGRVNGLALADDVARRISAELGKRYPRFDEKRFLQAVVEGVVR